MLHTSDSSSFSFFKVCLVMVITVAPLLLEFPRVQQLDIRLDHEQQYCK